MAQPTWIGRTLGGRYRIDALLGQGGMSAVYRATDPNLDRVVAIKLIHPHLSTDPEFVRRFEEEARAVAQLRHPNIIQVYDFNHEEDVYYIVFEFVPGETLQDRLKRFHGAGHRLSLEETVNIGAGVADALVYAHERGLVHRDIKPANVMLNVNNNPILMDFGIVKIVGGTQHTATGAVMGTARYMSPEQIRGQRIDERTDIYSLGVMLFEMAGGRAPFEADSAMTVMMMHVNDPVPDLTNMRPDVPPPLAQVINRALAKEREQRYQSAGDVAADLRTIDLTGSAPGAAAMGAAAAEATVLDSSPEHTPVAPASAGTPAAATPPPVSASPAAATATPPEGTPPAAADSDRRRLLMIGGGAALVILLLACVVVGAIAFNGGLLGGDGDGEAGLDGTATAAAIAEATAAAGGGAGQETEATATATLAPSPSASATQAATATSPPPTDTPEPDRDGDGVPDYDDQCPDEAEGPVPAPGEPGCPAPPTPTPTATVPPGIPFARINDISIDGGRYVVEYETFEYEPQLPGVHVHFFFDTVPPEEAGVPGNGPWILYGGPVPFTQYGVGDRPAAAEEMCILVANADHSVQANSGNCYALPETAES